MSLVLYCTDLQRPRVGDGPVSRRDQEAPPADLPHRGPQSPCEELAERGVLAQLVLALRPIAAGGSREYPQYDELYWLGELGGGQPAPPPGEGGQGQQGVQEAGRRGPGGGRAGRSTVPARRQEAGEEEEGGGGEDYSQLRNTRLVRG